MKYIINSNRELAQSEVDFLNERTKHLWTDGITQRLITLYPNRYNDQWMYLLLNDYAEYYTSEMMSKAVKELPNDWSDNEEI
jgi:hypothetical protein